MSVFDEALTKAKEFGIPLYLTTFGSHLYGTNTETSDKDYKGIFLPSIKKLILDERVNSISLTTGSNNEKNSSEDQDIQLWTLQYWLKLLSKGDTNAIDLLASMYSKHNEKFVDLNPLGKYKDNPMALMDLKYNKAYIAYAFGQAKKYGIKGSKVGLLRDILNFISRYLDINKVVSKNLNINPIDVHNTKVETLFDSILEKFYNPSLCFEKECNNQRALFICGKGYMGSICISEMVHRLIEAYDKYGDRARQADQNQNIDWKAVSHALRCLDQVIEMAETGQIVHYPLKNAQYLIKVKQGYFDWHDIENVFVANLEEAEKLIANVPENNNMQKVHEEIILNAYDIFADYKEF